MAQTKRMLWASCLIFVLVQCHLPSAKCSHALSNIGINWGALTSHPINPYTVVDLLKDNGIKKVKLFDVDSWTLGALAGSGIEVMIGIPNDQMERLSNSGQAEQWVKQNLTKHLHGGVDIRYISVGNEPFLASYENKYRSSTFPAMKSIQKAVEKAGVADQVKVTSCLNADVLDSGSDKPSDGQFRSDIKDVMKEILQFLNDNNSPFFINIYPYLSLYLNPNFPEELAFFDAGRSFEDKGATYTNVFDASVDTLVWALKKEGYSDMKIVVGEVGWPTDGHKSANKDKARRFYHGFLKKLGNQQGSPLHPGVLDVYLFGLFDENLKSIEPGKFERHWGIFEYDGKPKFPVDFSGKGEDHKWPVGAKGVRYLEKQWCVLSEDVKEFSGPVYEALGYACANTDCTSLGYGCSCADLDIRGNISYAFNQYFQARDQSIEACDFDGLAEIVTSDPSKGTCKFPIVIESAATSLQTRNAIIHILLLGFALFFVTFM
ncbi:glucan endo-1,3-beta-glucosidase 8-like [Arachis stenosperma]|uniref:glucan endo-1,3-beta-glucosidase 8-like n=1 Tax=Arachis stenosperma TaxID=217475 RepID=UPI0025AD2B1B|nr:glucan endo-1,3-beta-glucosidase 8-like [Arachis stenosperma]